ncbi:hypothetical protein COCMIDRAFT_10184 [Bipolaris oryzae ATCC 44560]|uniref:glutathione transferase n=1 Tax=Bipolaris oryzae ATCC 44560 TaxID=930090 RepID=W6YQ98_COCMI|nr:uncharacterized protein COCMIDRAFT_10184 [Bipolaris oryzae ATCC 44560]EUC39795.1 hypothetical protein COCMIDRAFT_10184 [Bipolaris oryzae ATCC 44560]
MSFNLTGIAHSICTLRPLLVLAEKGVEDFTLHAPNIGAGEHKTEQYRKKHPFGQIPILEDNDFVLFESRAISRFLAIKFANQGTPLLPSFQDEKAWALFEQWASVEQNNFDHFAQEIFTQKKIRPMFGQPVDEVALENAKKTLAEKLDVFDGILAKQDYLGGTNFSLVDIFYMPLISKLFEVNEGDLVGTRPSVQAWWDRVSARKSWKRLAQ